MYVCNKSPEFPISERLKLDKFNIKFQNSHNMRLTLFTPLTIIILIAGSFFFPEGSPAGYVIKALVIALSGLLLLLIHARYIRPLRELNKRADEIRRGNLDLQLESLQNKHYDPVVDAFKVLRKNTINAISFIKDIENGKLDVEYYESLTQGENGTTDKEKDEEQENDKLAESLISLKDRLNEIAQTEKDRNWVTEGLAKFVEILRASDEDLQSLSDKILSNLVQYLKANQGQMYIINDDQEDEAFLEMTAFYAYDRKKFLEKRVEMGQGLVGQAFQEKGTVVLTEVPENYISVTSGLGEAPPRCILIVPLKINEEVYGIIEIASFQVFQQHEIEFVEKIGESIASTVSNAKVNQKTKGLLEELQQQSEEMKAQEEEMRQNMEELQATQEEMARKEKEITKLLEESNTKEKELADKLKDIENMKEALELENAMFTGLMDILSDRITIKDRRGAYLRVNKTKADAFSQQGITDYIGKTDADFFGEEHYQKALSLEKEIMDSGEARMNQEDRVKMPNGKMMWASTSRAPFKNKTGKVLGTLVVTRNITELRECQENLEKARSELKAIKKK